MGCRKTRSWPSSMPSVMPSAPPFPTTCSLLPTLWPPVRRQRPSTSSRTWCRPASGDRTRAFFLFFVLSFRVFFGVHAAWLDLRSAIASKGSRNQGLEQPLGGGLSRGTFVRSLAMKSCPLFFLFVLAWLHSRQYSSLPLIFSSHVDERCLKACLSLVGARAGLK